MPTDLRQRAAQGELVVEEELVTVQSIRALGVTGLRVNNPSPHRRVPQLLLNTGEGIEWRLLQNLYPAAIEPGLDMDSLLLSPSGQTLLGQVFLDPDGARNGRYTPSGQEQLVLIDIATGQQRSMPFIQRGRAEKLYYGLAPNEQGLAVALTESTAEAGSVTLKVLGGSDLAVSAERVFDGSYMVGGQQDTQLQWSPDGRFLALSIRALEAPREAVLVLDAETLETVMRVDPPQTSRVSGFMQLAGSASWSPDSQRLMVLDDDQQRILHLTDGRQEKLAWLNGLRGDPPRQPQILGLLSEDRALVQRQRGTRLRLSSVDLCTGKGPVLADVTVAENDLNLQMAISRQWENLASAL